MFTRRGFSVSIRPVTAIYLKWHNLTIILCLLSLNLEFHVLLRVRFYIRAGQQKYAICGEAWIFQDVTCYSLGYFLVSKIMLLSFLHSCYANIIYHQANAQMIKFLLIKPVQPCILAYKSSSTTEEVRKSYLNE